MKFLAKLAALSALGLGSCCASAGLIGSQITGELYFGVGTVNYFNPAQLYVPAGFGNLAGTTVTVGAGQEFGFRDGSNFDIADFSDTQLFISDEVFGGAAASWVMRFTSVTPGLFQGFSLASSSFSPALGFSLVGNVITVTWAGTNTNGTQRSSFNVSTASSVPEPSVLSLLALTGIGLLASRKAAARS